MTHRFAITIRNLFLTSRILPYVYGLGVQLRDPSIPGRHSVGNNTLLLYFWKAMLRCRRLAQNDVHHLETTVGKVTRYLKRWMCQGGRERGDTTRLEVK